MPKEKLVSTYQFKITLQDSKPPIWRRFIVPDSITLPKLHRIIQAVMGWTDSRIHEFVVEDAIYGVLDPERPSDLTNEARVKMNKIINKVKQKFIYLYDFNNNWEYVICGLSNGWEHVIELEKIIIGESTSAKPQCIAGKMACPPEDCRGIDGYYYLLEAMRDPDHPEHEDIIEWLGDNFDPKFFDIDEVNEILAKLK